MSEENDSRSIVSTAANKFANIHTSNPITPIILAILSELPLVGIGKEVIDQSVTRIHQKRFNTLIDELKAGEKHLTEEVIQSEEFIHSVVVVYRAAINTYHEEKIKYFARLLVSAIEEGELASSKFEEFVDILEDLSPRELTLLKILKRTQEKHSLVNPNMNTREKRGQFVFSWWDEFAEMVEIELEIPPTKLPAHLTRLSRTGLYESLAGMILDYSGGMGTTTELLDEFFQWILHQADVNKE